MATVTESYTITPTNITATDPTGRTVIVGGASSLGVDDNHATYVEKVWANFEAPNAYFDERSLLVTCDIPPPPVPAGATNVTYGTSYTYSYRGFRADYHGVHEVGYVNLPPHPSGAQRNWLLGSTATTQLSTDTTGAEGIVTRTTSEPVDWSVGLPSAELQISWRVTDDPYHDIVDTPQCRVVLSYLAFTVSATYDEPAAGSAPRGPRIYPVKSQQASPRRGPGSYY